MKKLWMKWRRRRFIRKIRLVKRVLKGIDRRMMKLGMPTWKRQQIRRDIVNSDKAWLDFVGLLGD